MSGERKLTEDEFEKIYENFESADLLTAIDHLDQLRYLMDDQEDLRPPVSREHLFKLHDSIFAICGHYIRKLDVEGTHDMLDELHDLIFNLQDNAQKLERILDNLRETLPEPDYDSSF